MQPQTTRREFFAQAAGACLTALGAARWCGATAPAGNGPLSDLTPAAGKPSGDSPMKAIDILKFFHDRAPWIQSMDTVDRIIVGDGDKPVRRVLVTWMPTLAAVRHAIDGGYDMLMAHEPTFYDHRDYRDNPQDLKTVAVAKAKKKLIEDSGLVIVRNHDTWDVFPEVGIAYAWGQFLGFGNKPAKIGGGNYMHRYDIAATTLDELAGRVAARVASLGEDAVQVVGDGGQTVSKVGTGCGCAANPATFQSMGCDVSIVTDDGTRYWGELQRAEDEGHPFIRVHHGTSEEPGMVTLTEYINANIPGVQADHLPHRPMYRTVRA